MSSQPWENTKFVLKFIVTSIYGWDPKVVIYSLYVTLLLMEIGGNR